MIFMVFDERDLLHGVFDDNQTAYFMALMLELLLQGHTPVIEVYALEDFI